MRETPDNKPRSTLRAVLGFLLGTLVCISCLFFSILLGGALGLRHAWMFPTLNAIALVASGMLALRKAHKSSYSEGVLIAVSVAFILNVLFVAVTLSRHSE